MAGVESLAAVLVSAAAKTAFQAGKDYVTSLVDNAKASALATEKIGRLVQEFEDKRDTYLTKNVDPGTAIETRRVALLKRLTASQNRILFEISDSDLHSRLVTFAIEQATSLYSASKEVEFALIEMNVSQIEALLQKALQDNETFKTSRENNRTLAIWFAATVIVAIIALISASSYVGLSIDTMIPVIMIPLPIVIWSCIGSLGAMLYRFNDLADAELADPLRWSFTRPLTGVLMGIIAYMVFKVGAVVLQPGAAFGAAPGAAVTAVSRELLWLAAFLAGFSDRFADSVLRSLTGRLGGERNAELYSAEQHGLPIRTGLTALADRLGWGRRAGISQEPPIVSPPAARADSESVLKKRRRSQDATLPIEPGSQAAAQRNSTESPPVHRTDPNPAPKKRGRNPIAARAAERAPQAAAGGDSTESPLATPAAAKRAPRRTRRPPTASPSSPESEAVAQQSTVVAFPETAPKENL